MELTFRCLAHISRLSFSPEQELAGCVATMSLPSASSRTSGRRGSRDGSGREMSCLAEQSYCKDKKKLSLKN